MKRKDIDMMREVRLWIIQIGLPIAGMVMVVRNPDILRQIKEGIQDFTHNITRGKC